MSSHYPMVLTEDQTLDIILSGKNIARFGDGELKLALGAHCISQDHTDLLSLELKTILRSPHPNCLVAIPNIKVTGPKTFYWQGYDQPRINHLFGFNEYGSAFITRPDSAPWINNPGYWAKVRQLWAGKHVTLVRGGRKSLTIKRMPEALSVHEIVAPGHNAYTMVDELEKELVGKSTVLLCLGATATVLANRLAYHRVHAMDLGHIGMFMKRMSPSV